jgi:hypothetical protein
VSTNKKVPVTVLKEGVRTVVGEAFVSQVGNLTYGRMVIDDEETADIIRGPISDISLGWTFAGELV